MREYRAYILEIDGHRFIRVKDFLSDQPDDEKALRAAKKLVDGHDVEVWDCGRLVARLSPDGETGAPTLAPLIAAADSARSTSNNDKISNGAEEAVSSSPSSAPNTVETNHLALGW